MGESRALSRNTLTFSEIDHLEELVGVQNDEEALEQEPF